MIASVNFIASVFSIQINIQVLFQFGKIYTQYTSQKVMMKSLQYNVSVTKNAIIIIVQCNYKSPELSIKKSPIMV